MPYNLTSARLTLRGGGGPFFFSGGFGEKKS